MQRVAGMAGVSGCWSGLWVRVVREDPVPRSLAENQMMR